MSPFTDSLFPSHDTNEIRKFNIKSVKDWRLFKNSNKKPNLIPSSPESVYKSEWRGFPDFLGY